jgi:transposase
VEQAWSLRFHAKKNSKDWRLQQGKNEYPTVLLTDTQSTKNIDVQPKSQTGYDGGKKTKGIKKSISVDTTGFPPDASLIQIETANTGERSILKTGFEKTQKADPYLMKHVQKNFSDGGYDGETFISEIQASFGITMEITERTDIAKGIVAKIRWISERTFAWLDNSRRMSKNYEGTFRSVKSMIVVCFIRLLCRRLAGGCVKKWAKKVAVA